MDEKVLPLIGGAGRAGSGLGEEHAGQPLPKIQSPEIPILQDLSKHLNVASNFLKLCMD